jgi:hypothetical protein
MSITHGSMKCSAATLFAVIGCALVGWLHLSPPIRSGDEWRRTADGWERTGHWEQQSSAGSAFERPLNAERMGKKVRFDTHPAVLALFQLVATFLALKAFPYGRERSITAAGEWKALLARSFRASAFGS